MSELCFHDEPDFLDGMTGLLICPGCVELFVCHNGQSSPLSPKQLTRLKESHLWPVIVFAIGVTKKVKQARDAELN